ncbi:thiopurine S-methyltransferase-like [Ostrea edulis]|uniref:thiopurine S-methyltransferase-like n=1 Tax=Ostrea edulis TaxID=37623 RepID=UPI002094142F|nr:thiopurine S-methyltransferase-like [Ostrea edulis]
MAHHHRDHDKPQQKMTVGMWKECWNTPNVEFHNPDLNELFVKYNNRMLTRPGMRIFVPMCGKAVEMKWLLDHGYKVVGLEVAPVPCKAFFEENNIPYHIKDIHDIHGEKYESLDGNIVIYCCDFFHFSREICGDFEAIWDSGGLNSMDVEDRPVYVHRIRTLMGQGCVNMTEFVNFDPSIVDIPWSMTTVDLQKCFGEGYSIEDVSKMEASKRLQDQGCNSVQLFTITKT